MNITPRIYHFGKSTQRKKMEDYQIKGMEISQKERKTIYFIKKQLINSKGNICALCGKPILNMKDCTIDHIIPISKGGLTTLDNCQLAHSECNNKKADSLLLEEDNI